MSASIGEDFWFCPVHFLFYEAAKAKALQVDQLAPCRRFLPLLLHLTFVSCHKFWWIVAHTISCLFCPGHL